MTDHYSKLKSFAESSVLLVASDYDGTLAPIAARPGEARPDTRSIEALIALARMPHTYAAIITGRARADLIDLVGDLPGIEIIGSHGIEGDPLSPVALTEPQATLLESLNSALTEIAARDPGFLVERKPTGVAFHYRTASTETAERARFDILDRLAGLDGVQVRFGTMVIELSVVPGDKGTALAALRRRVGASATIFLGDDQTDEDAFAVLAPGDLGIVVGQHPTLASLRLDGTEGVAELLRELARLRKSWLDRRAVVPINHHAILSDQRTIAIVEPTGCISWLCVPRIDSAPLFARLLGGDAAGFFAISPCDDSTPIAQEYDGDSFVLETRWPDMTVTDYLDCTGGRPFQRAGRTDLIRVVRGKGRASVRFAPRLDCGRTETYLLPREGGLEIDGAPEPIVLHAPGVVWQILDDGIHKIATAEVNLDAGPFVFELRYGTRSLVNGSMPEPERRAQTHGFWATWLRPMRFPAVATALVRRSALALRALCYGPTGAIAAAGTTSLPEQLGGERNWDYRFCWTRDATLAAAALVRLGNTGVAMRLCDWLLGIIDHCESPDRMRPIYTVTSGHLGSEGQINELSGYAGSRPVRVGNAAAQQVQLDVFGPIADLIATLAQGGAPISPEHWRLVKAMVAAVETRWQEADHGIWETRGPRRHHVHSKVMCWHTVDRAIYVQDQFLGQPNKDWETLRDRIRDDILDHGWNPNVGAFTSAYGDDAPDAATLQVGLTGLLGSSDERFVKTVEVVERELRCGGSVYRYRYDDGLPGQEGTFHLCTWWLIESYLRLGRLSDARELFESFLRFAGPTGLFSEEHDPELDIALGNFPQAYSHIALINSAIAIANAGA